MENMKAKIETAVKSIITDCGKDLDPATVQHHTNLWVRKHLGMYADQAEFFGYVRHLYYPMKNCAVVEQGVPIRTMSLTFLFTHAIIELGIKEERGNIKDLAKFAECALNMRSEIKNMMANYDMVFIDGELKTINELRATVLILKCLINSLYIRLSGKNRKMVDQYAFHRMSHVVDTLIANGGHVLYADLDEIIYVSHKAIDVHVPCHNGRVTTVVFGEKTHIAFDATYSRETVRRMRLIRTSMIVDPARATCKPNKRWKLYLQPLEARVNSL